MTITELRACMPALPAARAAVMLEPMVSAMVAGRITTPRRKAMFLAQLGHESADLQYLTEVWGPTKAQRGYEGRADLGNTQPGDGYRYRGRGAIQLTGRANYRRYGGLLGVDLEGHPELAAAPMYAFRIAMLYWTEKGLNVLSDSGNITEVTRTINGGLNGLADRKARYERALRVFGAK